MTKFILRVFSWLLVVGVCSAQSSGGAQNGRLTHDLTVGAAHDIPLKGGQTVQVLSQTASTVVIMVQLSDGSNGVYQVGPGDVYLSQQKDTNPPPAANSTAAGGVITAPTVNEMPTLSQINSLPRRLSLVAAVSPQNLDIKTGSDEKLQIDALPKGTVLIPLGIQGDSLVVSIHARLVTSQLVDPNWNNTSLNVNVAPHPVTHTREVNGKGLIPLSDTDYNQVVAGMGKAVTFTAKDGRQYGNVQVFTDEAGSANKAGSSLTVVSANETIKVPYGQLPDDLSSFPKNIVQRISDNTGFFLSYINKDLASTANEVAGNIPTATHIQLNARSKIVISYNGKAATSLADDLRFDHAVVDADNSEILAEFVSVKSNDGGDEAPFVMISIKGRTSNAIQLQCVDEGLRSVPEVPLTQFPILIPMTPEQAYKVSHVLECLSTIFPYVPNRVSRSTGDQPMETDKP